MGRLSLLPDGAALDTFTAVSAADIVNTNSTAVKAATTGSRYIITDIAVSNMDAAVNTRVDILSGATVVWSGPASANAGGFVHQLGTPIVCGLSEAINAQCGTDSAMVRVAVSGYVRIG